MADSVRITPPTDPAPPDRTNQVQPAKGAAFAAMLAAHAPATGHQGHATHGHHARHGHGSAAHGATHSHVHRTAPAQTRAAPAHHAWAEKTAAVIPDAVQHALTQAMRIERVPESWHAGLQFIMAQESSGRVGVRNHVDTARGLFQLTRASYALNPNGAGSFGNALEEAQGGIRYIREHYGTADNAAGFWRQRRWY